MVCLGDAGVIPEGDARKRFRLRYWYYRRRTPVPEESKMTGISPRNKLAILTGLARVNSRGQRWPRIAAQLVGVFLDRGGGCAWSVNRLAVHLGVSSRTISRGLAFLRCQGVLGIRYRRRATAIFAVKVELLLAAICGGFAFIKAKLAQRREMLRPCPMAQATPLLACNSPKSYRIEGPPSAALRKIVTEWRDKRLL